MGCEAKANGGPRRKENDDVDSRDVSLGEHAVLTTGFGERSSRRWFAVRPSFARTSGRNQQDRCRHKNVAIEPAHYGPSMIAKRVLQPGPPQSLRSFVTTTACPSRFELKKPDQTHDRIGPPMPPPSVKHARAASPPSRNPDVRQFFGGQTPPPIIWVSHDGPVRQSARRWQDFNAL